MKLSDYVGPGIATKLVNVLGEDRAQSLVREVLDSLGLVKLHDAADRLRFGQALVERAGVMAVIGHSIQTQALLHGAMSTLRSAGIATPVP